MLMDNVKYPGCAAYIASLPQGLESYPQCTMVAEALQVQRSILPQMDQLTGLPAPLQQLIKPFPADQWVPEVHAIAVGHAIRDALFTRDEDHAKFIEQLNEQLLNRPLYRALFRLLSPQLLVMGAARRWNTLHRGTTLEADPTPVVQSGRRRIRAIFTFPPRLMDAFVVERYSRACLVAVRLSGGKNAIWEPGAVTDTRGEFSLTWDA